MSCLYIVAGSGGMQAGQQQQAPAQQPHAQLGNSDLQKNLLDQGMLKHYQVQEKLKFTHIAPMVLTFC